MNLKFLSASLIGVSSIGGAVAGGIYLSKSKKTENSQETNTQNSSKTKDVESNSAPREPEKPLTPALQPAPPAKLPEATQSPQAGPDVAGDARPKGPTGP